MAVRKNGVSKYEGCVMETYEKYWLDGMHEVFAKIWNPETKEFFTETVDYYGADMNNLCRCSYEIDLSSEMARDILRSKKVSAYHDYEVAVLAEKRAIRKGRRVKVVRGRNVPKGTELEVFWVGKRETYSSRMNRYSYYYGQEFEDVAGCYDADGNKVWIKVEYLENITEIKSPNAKERRKFVKAWMLRNYGLALNAVLV